MGTKNVEGRARAVELHLKGWTYSRIGKELGLDPKTISKYVRSEFRVMARERGGIEAQRAREVGHLEHQRQALLAQLEAAAGPKAVCAISKELRGVSNELRLLAGLDKTPKTMPLVAPWLNQDDQQSAIEDVEPDAVRDAPQPGPVEDRPAP